MKIFISFLLLFSLNAKAQIEDDRGFLFNLGEKLMNLGGYSYLDLHMKLKTSDQGLAACLVENAQVKFILGQKEQELKTYKEAADSPEIPTVPTPAPTPSP